MKVRDVMTNDVISVREDNSVEDVARLMASYRISGAPVVDANGAVVGLVTEYDLISKQGHTAGDVMTRGVVTVSQDTDVEEVTHLLTNRRIRRVPVMDGGKLVGILSRSDLIRQIAMRWVCDVCGYVERSMQVPNQCSNCGASSEAFVHAVEPPGM